MDTMIYVYQENGRPNTPAIKSRQRLQSASGGLTDKPLKTPLSGKSNVRPLLSGRKALGTINKIFGTPSVSQKGREWTKPREVQQCKARAASPKSEEYPEIEKCFPYNPSEFETYDAPEEVCLSRLSLAGLARLPWPPALPEEDLAMGPLFLPPSPVMAPTVDLCAELDAFLQTVSKLTVDLPPECDY